MKTYDLNSFRDRLVELRDRLDVELGHLTEMVLTDAQPVGEHDRAVSESTEKEEVLVDNEVNLHREVTAALHRMADGTYGRCTECGERIARERLLAMPYVALCIACEREREVG